MGRGGQHAPSQLSRLLDYRCHAPDGALGKGFPRSMTQCLGVLARSPSDRAVPATEDGGIAEALGVRTAKQRKAVAAYAVRMLGEGMEAAVSAAGREWQSPLGLTPATPPPCCSMLACDRPLPLPPPSSPPLPSPRSTLGLAALGRPHHPRSLGLLWMPTRPATRMLTRGENGRTVETIPAAVASLATASISHASRDASAFYARAAAARLADAGGLPSAFDDRYLNPCWLCNRSLCCLPYAHILGVSKCGTTDLYARLAAHPSVLASANKGPHFWDEGSHDFSWYVSLFTGVGGGADDLRLPPSSGTCRSSREVPPSFKTAPHPPPPSSSTPAQTPSPMPAWACAASVTRCRPCCYRRCLRGCSRRFDWLPSCASQLHVTTLPTSIMTSATASTGVTGHTAREALQRWRRLRWTASDAAGKQRLCAGARACCTPRRSSLSRACTRPRSRHGSPPSRHSSCSCCGSRTTRQLPRVTCARCSPFSRSHGRPARSGDACSRSRTPTGTMAAPNPCSRPRASCCKPFTRSTTSS